MMDPELPASWQIFVEQYPQVMNWESHSASLPSHRRLRRSYLKSAN